MATRASDKVSGETVPEVHGADKELDSHIMPEQQYVSKVQTPKGARLKILKTPIRDSPHNTESEMKSDPVRTTRLPNKTARESPKMHEKLPYKSPRVRLVQPWELHVETPKRG